MSLLPVGLNPNIAAMPYTDSLRDTIGSFVAEGRAVVEERVPESYPAWLFWVGFLLAPAWFGVAERRQRAT